MKILHCSDIHLGRRIVGAVGDFSDLRFDDYFKSFEYIIDYAVNNPVDVFVVAGDLFDKKEISPEVLARTEFLFAKLKNANIQTLVIEGNHDKIKSGKEKESWINYLEEKQLIIRPHYIENGEEIDFNPYIIDNVRFFGLGYPGFFTDELIELFAERHLRSDGFIDYVIIHTALLNPDIMMGTIKHDSILKLVGKVDYVAGGHFHDYNTYPKDEPIFFVPGSPEMWDFGEYRQQKGFIIFDTETGLKEFFPTINRKKHVIKATIDMPDLTSANLQLNNIVSNEEISDSPICYLLLDVKHQIELDLTTAEDILLSKGAVKVISRITGNRNNLGDFSGFDSTIAELESALVTSWEKFGKIPDETMLLLQNMKQYQIENLDSDFKDLLNNFLDKMITGE